jgi:hypothetical protein
VVTVWNIPSEERLSRIPRIKETEPIPLRDKLVHLHFFMGGCDWYVVEYDGENLFFGYAILNNDYDNAEWGYVSFQELKRINISGIEVDCEKEEFWDMRKAGEIRGIVESGGIN